MIIPIKMNPRFISSSVSAASICLVTSELTGTWRGEEGVCSSGTYKCWTRTPIPLSARVTRETLWCHGGFGLDTAQRPGGSQLLKRSLRFCETNTPTRELLVLTAVVTEKQATNKHIASHPSCPWACSCFLLELDISIGTTSAMASIQREFTGKPQASGRGYCPLG